MGRAHNPSTIRDTILLVEDEPLVRIFGVDVLEEAGYQVIEAANADLALKVLEADPRVVSVLVTDVHMPGSLDGCDLARIVEERWPWIRLVVTSGEAKLTSADVPDHGRFIPKPWSDGAIVKAVAAAGAPE
jgi:CheY-like chemotaxis protein